MATSDDMREQIRNLSAKFDGLENKVDGLGLRVGGLERKVDQLPTRDELTGFKDEFIKNFRILADDAKDSAKKAAEGYGATLQRIETNLGELNRKMDTKFSDHDRVLANHNDRLVALEPRQRL